ncbi:MAG: NAD-dependent epimerase/dehydratase family protein [Kiritimatiellae bacterium]|nr:NAD-dependent epimerase/dehydratase family protein [Kiritimatiellia bacterium]
MGLVLITGAFGFIGTNLSAWLARRGHRLLALDVVRRSGTPYAAAHTWDELDNLPWDSLGAVVHLAGKAHDTRQAAEPQAYFDVNVGLTRRVFDRYLASRAGAFILFSSVKAVADRVARPPLTEDVEPAPGTPYGQSKLEAETYLRSRPGASGRALYVLRPCMVHGPGNKGNLNLLWSAVRRGMPYPLGAFPCLRSMTAIENLCVVVERLIGGGVAPGTYNVCDDDPVDVVTVVSLMAECLGRRPRVLRVNPRLVRLGAALGDRLHLPLNTERLAKLTEPYVVSNERLRHALGLSHLPVAAEEGLRRTFRSFVEDHRR